MEEEEESQLSRSLSVWDGSAIVFGIMIGTGIFASPGVVLVNLEGSVGFSLMVWLGAGILSLLGGLCFAELGAAIPTSGGDYVYLLRGIHPVFGFMFTWASFLCLRTGAMSIIAVIFGRYLGSIVFSLDTDDPEIDSDIRVKFLAMGSIGVLSLVNLLPVKWSSLVQKITVLMKFVAIAAVLLLAIVGLVTGKTTDVAKDNFSDVFRSDDGWTFINFITSIGVATISALWAYDGFSNLNAVAEEVKNPGKNIPASIILAVTSVTLTYVLINVSYLLVLPASSVMSSKAVAIDMASAITGDIGEVIMALLVALSAFGALNGSVLISARVFYATARDGLFPFANSLQKVNRYDIPWVAVLMQGFVAAILIIPGNFESLVNYFGFTAWIFYALVVVALIRMRYTEKELERPFVVKPFPWLPIIFIGASMMIVGSALIEDTIPSLLALLLVLSGAPLYYLFFWKGNAFKLLWKHIQERRQQQTEEFDS